ncbi:class I SAM-dependent DNA methyltransferase [Erythrobacter westpacificensis]|uniref:site-specific DNA-methyltransferase (adenine-specific) n=1 Tax=Erythrobacter westpacificensis TaxID=1055231 RepID=A0ABP9KB68_9SPHN
MSEVTDNLQAFLDYAKLLKGDEKGEAQVFCDRLFQAFGHKGYKEAGAELEFRIKKKSSKGTSFADLIWKPRLLLEMKRRGENLFHHYQQAFDYWIHAVPNRPRYVVLCNFDEFRIYDFDKQIDEPVDIVALTDLPRRYPALNFLFPEDPDPVFGNDLEAVSRDAADKVAQLFNSLIKRDVDRSQAQRFVLQTVVAMFAEDIGLLPASIVYNLAHDCLHKGQSAYDQFGALFRQMNNKAPADGGRFQKVPYFNGGIFKTVTPVDLQLDELELVAGEEGAATKDWSKVNPAIFGTIFQQSMDAEERHAYGAHFTSEADILRIVMPTIVRPWRERIEQASTMKELLALRSALMSFKVLDPACGSGNFLYLSYRELVRVEIALMAKLKQTVSEKNFREQSKSLTLISPRQFFGIDRDSFGVELAKVTLMLAKKLALDESIDVFEREQMELPLNADEALPLDNLDANFQCADALFANWPETDVVVGNPPYLDARKLTIEHGRGYVDTIRAAYPDVPGRADYCVYWFRKAHDHLPPNSDERPFAGRAGLVGTNTIRQNYSREGGLDYVVSSGGTITDAVASQVWSGEAAVNVSIVNWIKGPHVGKCILQEQLGDRRDSDWKREEVEVITSALTSGADVSKARELKAVTDTKLCFEGQQPGHVGFRVDGAELLNLSQSDPNLHEIAFPYLIGNSLLSGKYAEQPEFLLDFDTLTIFEASQHKAALALVKERVLPKWEENAAKEFETTGLENGEHQNRLKTWWQIKRRRNDMLNAVVSLSRYAVCVRHTKRPLFVFLSNKIRPDSALTVFAFEDDYSFGILQSDTHWHWFVARCSTIKRDFRYTNETIFTSFPWPQNPTLNAVQKVADASRELRILRQSLMKKHGLTYRALYRTLELPGASPLKDAHAKLDQAVRTAYGMKKSDDPLSFLFDLNQSVAKTEDAGKQVTGPGLPPVAKDPARFTSDDCVEIIAPSAGKGAVG